MHAAQGWDRCALWGRHCCSALCASSATSSCWSSFTWPGAGSQPAGHSPALPGQSLVRQAAGQGAFLGLRFASLVAGSNFTFWEGLDVGAAVLPPSRGYSQTLRRSPCLPAHGPAELLWPWSWGGCSTIRSNMILLHWKQPQIMSEPKVT